jgi:hypothetical protein
MFTRVRKTKTKSMWYKLKKAQFKLFCAKANKEIKKLAVAIVLTEFVLAGVVAIVANYNYFGLLDTKTVYIEIARAQEAPKLPQDEVSEVKRIADTIWNLESTRGQHNYSKCEAIGKTNQIGYGIYNGKYMCFENHAEEMKTLENWIQKKLDSGMTENQLKCLYNTGNKTDSCDYIK